MDQAAGDIKSAVQLLLGGEPVIYPTETYFALGVDPRNDLAVSMLTRDKARTVGAGFPLIIAESGWIDRFIDVETPAQKLRRLSIIHKFWPGPLSLVFTVRFELRSCFAPGVLGPEGSLAVRVSSEPLASELALGLGGAIISTSANPRGAKPPVTRSEAHGYFPNVFVVGDLSGIGRDPKVPALPSTLLDLRGDELVILRPGPISLLEIARVIESSAHF